MMSDDENLNQANGDNEYENEETAGEAGQETGQEAGLLEGQSDDDDDDDDLAELAEIEYSGKQYKVPKELREAFLRQEDYSRKSQEVAEQRRVVNAIAETIAEKEQFSEATAALRAHELAIDERLGQFQNVNWQQFQAQNPQAAQAAWMQYQQLKDAKGAVENQIGHARELFAERTREAHAHIIEKGLAELKREIPNFSPALAEELVSYGVNKLGLDEQHVRSMIDPRAVKLLHKAYLYDKLLADKPGKTPASTQAQQPATTLRGGGVSAAKNPDKLSADEWLKWRNKQLAKRHK